MSPPAARPRHALEAMERQVRALFVHDATGRLLAWTSPDTGPAPAFFLGRTPLGNLWRMRADLPPATVRELARLAAREPPLPGFDEPPPPERWEALRTVLREAGAPPASEHRGPAFAFPERPAPLSPRADVRVLGEETSLLRTHFPSLAERAEAVSPVACAFADGVAVAVCHCAGRNPEGDAEAGVETAPAWRGRGLGRAVTAAWARAICEAGGRPLYSAAWSNRASRALAARLDLVPYGEDLHLTPG